MRVYADVQACRGDLWIGCLYYFAVNRMIGFMVPAFASKLSIPLTQFYVGYFLMCSTYMFRKPTRAAKTETVGSDFECHPHSHYGSDLPNGMRSGVPLHLETKWIGLD